MGPAIPRNLFILLLTLLLCSIPSLASASDYQTKHLFLVIIDGLRNDEAFEETRR